MLRRLALAVMIALVPIVASAQEEHRFERPGARPVQPHGPPGPAFRGGPVRGGPVVGPQGHLFSYRGRTIERIHVVPFLYPHGFGYRRWVVGGILPPVFLAPAYFYADWAGLGLAAPPPGYQWVRNGPDLLLVDVSTGQIVDTVYDVFY
jgi:hypothetical protein